MKTEAANRTSLHDNNNPSNMNTNEIDNKKELYKSPSVKVLVVSSEKIICTSPGSTEGYGINGKSLGDDDFE